MNFTEQLNKTFTPLSTAISDTFLQIEAKPLIFLIVWSLFALAPQLLLSFAFQQPITEMVEISYKILVEGPNNPDFQITEQDSRVIMGGLRATLVVLLSFSGLTIFVYSALGDIIAKFRKGLPPKIAQSLLEGLRLYVSLLKVVLASAGRILAGPAIIAILGGVIGSLLQQAALIYVLIIVSSVLLLMNLLRYGLAPFAHLALGISWRPALATSKDYYQIHRLAVLALFGFVVLLPLIVFGLLTDILLNLGILTIAVNMVFGILQSIVRFYMAGVLINFGMNNFSRHSGEIGEGG